MHSLYRASSESQVVRSLLGGTLSYFHALTDFGLEQPAFRTTTESNVLRTQHAIWSSTLQKSSCLDKRQTRGTVLVGLFFEY